LTHEENDERQFKPDTIFRIYSITKLFTAVSILKLVEDGKIRLDQPVGEILDEFNTPPYNMINIVHLLTHTSGIHHDEGAHDNIYHECFWNLLDNEDTWITDILKQGLGNTPGKEWSYSTLGYSILGEIITRVSGMFCHDYIQKNIVEPCEMIDTSFEMYPELVDRYNYCTDWQGKRVNRLRENPDACKRKSSVPITGNGMISTSRDVMKFGIMLLNNGTYNGKRILGRKAIEAMRRVHTSDEVVDYCWGAKGVHRDYGLGPDIFMASNNSQIITPNVIGHEGYGACSLCIDFEEKFVAVWASQFYEGDWYPQALRNVASIMWSGLE